jgi:hypothetical protein
MLVHVYTVHNDNVCTGAQVLLGKNKSPLSSAKRYTLGRHLIATDNTFNKFFKPKEQVLRGLQQRGIFLADLAFWPMYWDSVDLFSFKGELILLQG